MRPFPTLAAVLTIVGALSSCKETRKPDTQTAVNKAPPHAESTVLGDSAERLKESFRPTTPDSPLDANVFVDVNQLSWGPGPASMPQGAQSAVLEGKAPFQEEKTFMIAVNAPPNYTVPPHIHAATERITMLKGTAHLGHGSTLDKKNAMPVKAGGFVTLPAGHRHFAFTTNETATFILHGVGPWAISYVNPSDDPRQPPPSKLEHISQFDAAVPAKITNVADVKWEPAKPGMLPPGAMMSVLEGDPEVEGKTFTVRVKMPDGYTIPVHRHGISDRFIVLSGTLLVGIGDTWDDGVMREVKAPSVVVLDAGVRHFAKAKGETVLQVFGVGPYQFMWENADEDPGRMVVGRGR